MSFVSIHFLALISTLSSSTVMHSGYVYGNYSTGGFNTTAFPKFDYIHDGLITSACLYRVFFLL